MHNVQHAIKFGTVVYDWSNAKALWANAHPMNSEELITKQVGVMNFSVASLRLFKCVFVKIFANLQVRLITPVLLHLKSYRVW